MCATLDFVYKIHISATLASQTAPTAAISYAAHLARRSLLSLVHALHRSRLQHLLSHFSPRLSSSPILAPTRKDVLTLRTPKQRKKNRGAPHTSSTPPHAQRQNGSHTHSHTEALPPSLDTRRGQRGGHSKNMQALSLSQKYKKKEAAAEAKTTIGGTIQTSLA